MAKRKIKITFISTTEEMVMNSDFAGWRYARIEVFLKGEEYPVECGYIKVYNNDELFEAVRERLERVR